MGMTLAPAIADGLDADALWQDTRGTVHSYVLGGVTLNPAASSNAQPLNVQKLLSRLQMSVDQQIAGGNAAEAAALTDYRNAVLAKYNGDPNAAGHFKQPRLRPRPERLQLF